MRGLVVLLPAVPACSSAQPWRRKGFCLTLFTVPVVPHDTYCRGVQARQASLGLEDCRSLVGRQSAASQNDSNPLVALVLLVRGWVH